MRVSRVTRVFPSLKPQLQNQYDEKTYSAKKKTETAFKNLLEKELQPKEGRKINILF